MPKELPERAEIEDKYKWNLNDIYDNNDQWEQSFNKVTQDLNEIEKYKEHLTDSGETLLSGIKKVMNIEITASKLYAYAHMHLDENTRNQTYQALHNRAQDLHNKISSVTSFMVPEILTLKIEKVEQYIKDTPELEKYRHFLDNILRQKDHYLSAREERLIAMAGEITQGPNNIYSILNNADLDFPVIRDENGEEIRITHGRFIDFMKSKNRRVRKEAFNGLYSKYEQFINTFATTLNSSVKTHIYYAKARKYTTALESALDDDNVPTKVYNNLINTVKDNLEPMHQYIGLRKKLLNLDELHIYDIYTPLVKELEMKIPFEEAKDTILKGLTPLGNEYLNILKEGLESDWIDVYENRGKRSGAYSSGCYGIHPYVLLNYTEDINNMFTLAHEMGHALHTYYSNENQPFVYANYKIFVAEVASTLNETLLIHYLLDKTDDKLKQKYLINYYLEQFRGTVFRQTMFAEFEKIIHEKVEAGTPLTSQLLNEIYHKLNTTYYGENIIIDENINLEWARIPHFYYNFYVYKYATGFSAASALAQKIIEEGQPAVNRYIEFLKSGDSDYPINLLKTAGVDMTSPEPIKAAINVFNKYLNKLKALS